MSVADAIQLAKWSADAGWTGTDRITATAVAMAAGGDPTKPSGAWGVSGPAGDGAGQARAAYAAWRTQGWAAFPTHRSGSWLLYAAQATAAVTALGTAIAIEEPGKVRDATSDLAGAVGATTPGPLGDVADVVAFLTSDEAWTRVVKIGLGVILISAAAVSLAWSTSARPFLRGIGVIDDQVDAVVRKGMA